MKILFLWFVALTATYAQTTDEAAIRAVCRRETQAYFAADSKAFRDCWAEVTEAVQLYYSAQNNKVEQLPMPKSGLDNIAKQTQKPLSMNIETSNERMRVSGNAAFVQYDQHLTRGDGAHDYSHQTRYLEKMNGNWKIIHVGSVSHKFVPGTK